MLFNEMYALTDGGSFWGRPVGADKKTPYTFSLLECFDYAYYATLDVRFYASMPLLKFWPEIDKRVLQEFAETVPREWPEKGALGGEDTGDRHPGCAQAKEKGRGSA